MSPISSSITITVSMNTEGNFHEVGWVYYNQWFDEYVISQQVRLNYRVKSMFYLLFDTVAKHGTTSKYATQWRAAAQPRTRLQSWFTAYSPNGRILRVTKLHFRPFIFISQLKCSTLGHINLGTSSRTIDVIGNPLTSNTSYFTHIWVVVKSYDLDILDHELWL